MIDLKVFPDFLKIMLFNDWTAVYLFVRISNNSELEIL